MISLRLNFAIANLDFTEVEFHKVLFRHNENWKIGYRVRYRFNAVFIEVPKGMTHLEKYHYFFCRVLPPKLVQIHGQKGSAQLMIWVIFGTVLARNWTNHQVGTKVYRTNDPSGSANLVRAGPPDPASAAPTANPYW